MGKLTDVAIVAIHLENDVVHSEGAFSGFFADSAEERGVVAKAAQIVDSAHEAQIPVVFTKVGWDEGHRTLVANTPLLQIVDQQRCLTNGTWQTEIIEGITVGTSDLVLTNGRVSGFAEGKLDSVLRGRGVRTIVVFGVATNASVESTVRAGSDLGYNVVVVDDACSTTTEEAHAASIASMGLFAEITSSEELIARL